MFGGLNFDAQNDMLQARIGQDSVIWDKVNYTKEETLNGRQCHTAVTFENKIYIFGGCFKFNTKR